MKTTNLDRWFWRVFGKRGTVMINVGVMLLVAAVVASLFMGR